MTFINLVEIELALRGLAARFPDQAHLIELPNKTYEGRQSYALAIGSGPRCPAAGALIISGVHAREWGGPDICVNFAADLLEAYAAGTGLFYGPTLFGANGAWFTAGQIKRIVERLDVIVFPCVNPDGYQYSRIDRNWRKNRNPASSGGRADRIGVDINRNFDFVWDFATAFHPTVAAAEQPASANPGSDTFHGLGPFSEPEARNVAWLFDRFPQIGTFVDIHSYGADILHPWGVDDNQSSAPNQNFTKPIWNRMRGQPNRGYAEYIPTEDEERLETLGHAMRKAIAGVRGEDYTVSQSFWLPSQKRYYPTSGDSEGWAFSRAFSDPRKRAVSSFTIEFNRQLTFEVTWAEMQTIIPEIDAALVRLCSLVAPTFVFPRWLCGGLSWIPRIWPLVFPPEWFGRYGRLRWIPAALARLFRVLTLPFRTG